jgi:hypothetical protein
LKSPSGSWVWAGGLDAQELQIKTNRPNASGRRSIILVRKTLII